MIPIEYLELEKVQKPCGDCEDRIKTRTPAFLNPLCVNMVVRYVPKSDADITHEPEILTLYTDYGRMTVWGILDDLVRSVQEQKNPQDHFGVATQAQGGPQTQEQEQASSACSKHALPVLGSLNIALLLWNLYLVFVR